MAQQTAIEWFIEQLPLSSNSNGEFIIIVPQNSFQLFAMKAKQMEKEQIMNSWVHGVAETFDSQKTAEQYYNETYGNKS